jgi:hypothetical protein
MSWSREVAAAVDTDIATATAVQTILAKVGIRNARVSKASARRGDTHSATTFGADQAAGTAHANQLAVFAAIRPSIALFAGFDQHVAALSFAVIVDIGRCAVRTTTISIPDLRDRHMNAAHVTVGCAADQCIRRAWLVVDARRGARHGGAITGLPAVDLAVAAVCRTV